MQNENEKKSQLNGQGKVLNDLRSSSHKKSKIALGLPWKNQIFNKLDTTLITSQMKSENDDTNTSKKIEQLNKMSNLNRREFAMDQISYCDNSRFLNGYIHTEPLGILSNESYARQTNLPRNNSIQSSKLEGLNIGMHSDFDAFKIQKISLGSNFNELNKKSILTDQLGENKLTKQTINGPNQFQLTKRSSSPFSKQRFPTERGQLPLENALLIQLQKMSSTQQQQELLQLNKTKEFSKQRILPFPSMTGKLSPSSSFVNGSVTDRVIYREEGQDLINDEIKEERNDQRLQRKLPKSVSFFSSTKAPRQTFGAPNNWIQSRTRYKNYKENKSALDGDRRDLECLEIKSQKIDNVNDDFLRMSFSNRKAYYKSEIYAHSQLVSVQKTMPDINQDNSNKIKKISSVTQYQSNERNNLFKQEFTKTKPLSFHSFHQINEQHKFIKQQDGLALHKKFIKQMIKEEKEEETKKDDQTLGEIKKEIVHENEGLSYYENMRKQGKFQNEENDQNINHTPIRHKKAQDLNPLVSSKIGLRTLPALKSSRKHIIQLSNSKDNKLSLQFKESNKTQQHEAEVEEEEEETDLLYFLKSQDIKQNEPLLNQNVNPQNINSSNLHKSRSVQGVKQKQGISYVGSGSGKELDILSPKSFYGGQDLKNKNFNKGYEQLRQYKQKLKQRDFQKSINSSCSLDEIEKQQIKANRVDKSDQNSICDNNSMPPLQFMHHQKYQ